MLVRKRKKQEFVKWLLAKPARMILSSFLLIDLIGFFLLLLPISSSSGKSIGVPAALFTTVSATCVTGLVVVDTASAFSMFGKTVLISLIQIGGLGLVTITTFFISLMRKKVGLRTRVLAQENSGSFSFSELPALLRLIIFLTLIFEGIGFFVFSTQFVPEFGWGNGLAKAAFHSISSFCNAGFDLMGVDSSGSSVSLTAYSGNFVVMIFTMFLTVSGGLGFIVWKDILFFSKNKKLNLHSRITLSFTFLLIAIGALYFLSAEWGNAGEQAMASLPFGERPVAALFQSVTLRTAGFYSLNMANLSIGTKLFCVALMFIGAGSGSTGGGIKVSTFSLLMYSVFSEIRGEKNIIIRKHQIPRDAVQRAIALFVLSLGVVFFLSLLLTFTEAQALESARFAYIDLLFESVSAFATVGVSSANTAQLTILSQMCLIPAMFIGRVGPITFAVSLALREQKESSSVFPEGKIHIG